MLVAAIATAALTMPAGASATPSRPTVSPLPGTPDASPTTQISILGAARRRIVGVRVTGSISGVHPGRLRPYSAASGASFVLRRPLTEGERVAVVVRLRGERALRSRFEVARPAPIPPVLDAATLQPNKLDHFVSQPSLLAPKITVRRGASLGGGDIFLTPLPSPIVHPESNNELTITPVGPGGPMIVDRRGRLVWFDQLAPPLVATDFRPQRLHGREVLTWWQGKVTLTAFGLGEGVIADTRYRTIRTVRAGNGYQMDLHEFLLRPSGEALFTIESPVLAHLPGTPAGKLSPLLDSIVQEVDLRTGLVMWEWHAYGHIPLKDSYATPSNSLSYDAFHLNSIQALPDGRILLSARDTSAIYEVDQRTGRVLWTLGGKASTFRLARGARFYFQHDATLIGHDRVSLFDDGAGPPAFEPESRGLILSLDMRHHVARLAHQFHLPGAGTSAESEGDVQTLAGGNVFVGFGAAPFFSEFTASGKMNYAASLPTDDGSYREYLFPWHATPRTRPVAVARRSAEGAVVLHASWNGATTVRRWEVLARDRVSLRRVAIAADRGFETAITFRSPAEHVCAAGARRARTRARPVRRGQRRPGSVVEPADLVSRLAQGGDYLLAVLRAARLERDLDSGLADVQRDRFADMIGVYDVAARLGDRRQQ